MEPREARWLLDMGPRPALWLPPLLQDAFSQLDAREGKLKQQERELADARVAAAADLQSAELAKRAVEREREELQQLRVRMQEEAAAQAAEGRRLAELRQREAAVQTREAEATSREGRLVAAQQALADAERRARAGADDVAESIIAEARAEAEALLQQAQAECRRAEGEVRALREEVAASEAAVRRRELAADKQLADARAAAEAVTEEQRRAAEGAGLAGEKERLVRGREETVAARERELDRREAALTSAEQRVGHLTRRLESDLKLSAAAATATPAAGLSAAVGSQAPSSNVGPPRASATPAANGGLPFETPSMSLSRSITFDRQQQQQQAPGSTASTAANRPLAPSNTPSNSGGQGGTADRQASLTGGLQQLRGATDKGAGRLARLEGIVRAISQGPVEPASASEARRAVGQLRQQLEQLQAAQATLELQVKYSPGPSQLGALAGQVVEQQRALGQWEGRLGRQLEAIVGIQKQALSARSASSAGGRSGPDSAMLTPQASTAAFRGAAA